MIEREKRKKKGKGKESRITYPTLLCEPYKRLKEKKGKTLLEKEKRSEGKVTLNIYFPSSPLQNGSAP